MSVVIRFVKKVVEMAKGVTKPKFEMNDHARKMCELMARQRRAKRDAETAKTNGDQEAYDEAMVEYLNALEEFNQELNGETSAQAA